MFQARRRGFTLIELLVVITVIGILVAILLPYLSSFKESAKQTQCSSNMKQMALAVIKLDNRMPSSMFFTMKVGETPQLGLSADKAGKQLSSLQVGGDGLEAPFSFIVKLLSEMEQNDTFSMIDQNVGPFGDNTETETSTDEDGEEKFVQNNARAAATILPALVCPSFEGSSRTSATEYEVDGEEDMPALTQYKALGATTIEVLQDKVKCLSSKGQGGVINPWRKGLGNMKASTKTAILCETREEKYAAWMDGTHASIPGVYAPDGSTDVSQQRVGLNVGVEEEGDDPFLAESKLGDKALEWGPSSFHPGVVYHAMGGGNVKAISDDVGFAIYKALITKQDKDNYRLQDFFAEGK